MGYKAPKIQQVVQKTPDPLINLGETGADMQNERNKRGLLSTFLQGSRNRTAGTIGQALSNTRTTLGSSGI
jgi:hypothetical protein